MLPNQESRMIAFSLETPAKVNHQEVEKKKTKRVQEKENCKLKSNSLNKSILMVIFIASL